MHTEAGYAIHAAIQCAKRNGGATQAVALEGFANDMPDDADAEEIAQGMADLFTGISAADAIAEALALGIIAGREIERAARVNDTATRASY